MMYNDGFLAFAVFMLSPFVAFARISAPKVSRNLDSVCGNDLRLMVAGKCNDGYSFLQCAPNSEKLDYCAKTNPNWLEAKCKSHGGFNSILTAYSGCYPLTLEFWKDFVGLNIQSETDICGSLDTVEPLKQSASQPDNLGFEKQNLSGWNLSGRTGSGQVICSLEATEGLCYARVGTGCPTNSLSRHDILVSPAAGNSQCNDFVFGSKVCISFDYRFRSYDYLPYNDNGKYTISYVGGPAIATKVISVSDVGNVGDSGWMSIYQEITAPATVPLNIEIKVSSTNDRDCAGESYAMIDNVVIAAGSCP